MSPPDPDFADGLGIDAAVLSARAVFHNPRTTVSREPTGERECAAAVGALAQAYADAGGTVQEIIENSRGAAESLSSDPFQGLSEIVQNANDVGAGHVDIRLQDGLLEVRHDGRPVGLRDLHAMAAPWLTTKRDDEAATGRFGVGLSTLHAFSATFEIHSGDYHVEVGDPFLASLEGSVKPLSGPLRDDTMLRVRTNPDAVQSDDFIAWCEQWDDRGLLFLSSVTTVTFASPGWSRKLCLSREPESGFTWSLRGVEVPVVQEVVTAPDGRRWLLSAVTVPSPKGIRRAHKATGTTTPVGVALSLDGDPSGCLYAGLPIESVDGLPFMGNAQFDPMTNRQGMRDTAWNRELIDVVGALWKAAVLNLFEVDPAQAWGSVPLLVGSESSVGFAALLRDQIRCRSEEIAQQVTFAIRSERFALVELAIESEELGDLLTAQEVAKIAGRDASLPVEVRDAAGLWRMVTSAWRDAGVPLPGEVTVEDAVGLLGASDRPTGKVIALTAAAVRAGLLDLLPSIECVVDVGGEHHYPPTAGDDRVLIDELSGLATVLAMSIVIAPEYLADDEDATVVREWLREAGHLVSADDDQTVLDRLSQLGHKGEVLDRPLSDAQVEALRSALEPLGPTLWSSLGDGIGRAILLSAYSYDDNGKRVEGFARPCDAYQPRAVDREKDAFAVAAASTPDLTWLAPRYAQVMRSKVGRAGLGAQRFMRHLGCSTTPRLVPHQDLSKRFQSEKRLGLKQWIGDGLHERGHALTDLNCDYTLSDLDSPDLTAVLLSIAAEKRTKPRRERAIAMASLLSRSWRDLADSAEVPAAQAYNGWNVHGSVRAYWLWRAATIPWLDSVDGVPSAPQKLRLRTPSTIAVFGPHATGYLHPSLDRARPEVLQALGVAGDPNTHDLLTRLHDLQTAERKGAVDEAGPESAAVYQALAARLGEGRSSIGMTDRQLRAAFTARGGLIRTSAGTWTRPEDVFLDPPVFGARRDFVPSVAGASRLWTALQVRAPGVDDCIKVITEVAKTNLAASPADESIVINSLRLLEALLSKPGSTNPRRKRRLTQLPVWTTSGWTSTRPVYALEDPQLAEGVGDRVPVWQPGGEAAHYQSLLEHLRITLLPAALFHVSDVQDAEVDVVATGKFRSAARLLKEDLVRNDPDTERAGMVTWDELVAFDVRVEPNLQVEARMPDGTTLKLAADTKASIPDRAVFLREPALLDRLSGGGRAVASLFAADQRLLAQAWLAALEAERSGREAVELRLAREQAAAEEEDTQASIGRLRDMQAEVKGRRAAGKQKKSARPVAPGNQPPTKTGGITPAKQTPRVLVDPQTLAVVDADGKVVEGQKKDPSPPKTPGPKGGLRKPNRGGAAPTPRSTFRSYTDEEKETLGLELARRVLASDDQDIIDIRTQRRVGADAFDERGRYYELKVSARDEPDQIRLTDSEVERAMSTPDFFLVVVSGLEGAQAKPKVRVIVEPMRHLNVSKSSQVLLTGVHQAQSLVFDLAPTTEAVDYDVEPAEGDEGTGPED
ncbi:ATP-binding protein [Nocardioides bigeumensis]|uniref:DUF3883 domain-containing protein n=1 Tax=Nocardioides bigeumensis TaxID=433657 RepID=A0ABN2YTS3_9ACTN